MHSELRIRVVDLRDAVPQWVVCHGRFDLFWRIWSNMDVAT